MKYLNDVSKDCVEPEWAYVELPPSENKRGKRSRRVTELYGSW